MFDRSAIESRQLAQLNKLLGHLSCNPFYLPKLQVSGVNSFDKLVDFSSRFPLTTKQELVEAQLADPPYGTNLTFKIDEYTRFHQTSGTSGDPLRWLDTPQSWRWILEGWKTIFRKAEVTPADRLFAAFSFAPFIGFWSAFEAAADLGCLCISGGGLDSVARLRMIQENHVTVLCCTPTYGIHLGQVLRESQIDPESLDVRMIVVAGEPGGSIPSVRQEMTRLWNGARVFDHHGMTEAGPVSYECPGKPGTLMINEEHYLAEVIDPETLAAVGSGESGELILTTLGRTGAPLVRFRTGDHVRKQHLDDGGEAGNQLALEGGILGRIDDMVIVRGVNVYPTAIERIVRKHADIAEYRVEVEQKGALHEVNIFIEPLANRTSDQDLVKLLERDLRDVFALRIPVTEVDPGTLPRFELKAKRWIRKE